MKVPTIGIQYNIKFRTRWLGIDLRHHPYTDFSLSLEHLVQTLVQRTSEMIHPELQTAEASSGNSYAVNYYVTILRIHINSWVYVALTEIY
jgi:hypothetical protein